MIQQSDSRTLVIQPLPGVGDMIWHLRALKALAQRTPEKRISILTRARSQTHLLIGHEPYVDHIIYLDEPQNLRPLGTVSLSRKLRPYMFQTSWTLHRSSRYALASYLAGIPQRYGYGLTYDRFLINSPHLLTEDKKLHPIKRFEILLQKHHICYRDEDHCLSPHPQAVQKISSQLNTFPKPWIALGFGSSDPQRTWPFEKFSALAASLSKPDQNTVWLCGAPYENSLALSIQKSVQGNGKQAECATRHTLPETIALLSQCEQFIGNDSGLFNIASALPLNAWGIFRHVGIQRYTPDLFATKGIYSKFQESQSMDTISLKSVLRALSQSMEI